jgi:hypothetical protein|uniref:Uncharacterized protein n=1 Tax=Zea mays TaxID=4577 RepID=A0A804PGB4_MAIZE
MDTTSLLSLWTPRYPREPVTISEPDSKLSCALLHLPAVLRAVDLCSLDAPSSLTVCLSYAAPSLFPLVATTSYSTRSSGAALSSLWGLLGLPCFKMSSKIRLQPRPRRVHRSSTLATTIIFISNVIVVSLVLVANSATWFLSATR